MKDTGAKLGQARPEVGPSMGRPLDPQAFSPTAVRGAWGRAVFLPGQTQAWVTAVTGEGQSPMPCHVRERPSEQGRLQGALRNETHDSRGRSGPPRPGAGMHQRGLRAPGPRAHTALHVRPPTRAQHAEGSGMDGAGCSAGQWGSPTCPRARTRPRSLLGVSPSSGPCCAGAAHTGSWSAVNACWAAPGVPEPAPPPQALAGSSPELLTQGRSRWVLGESLVPSLLLLKSK